MKIGLIDVDGHNFPNLALMKISAFHKSQGDQVEWYNPLISGHCDKVYMSKVFTFTEDYEYFINADEIERGGLVTRNMTRCYPAKLIAFTPIIRFIRNLILRSGF